MTANRGAAIVHRVFGANLQQQGRGYYVALELLAIIRGVHDAGLHEVLDPTVTPIKYTRQSHDFARRIATNAHVDADRLGQAVQGETTYDTLHALLSSLVVAVPGRRSTPKWFAAHLYPFVGELVHYDAVERRKKPAIERYTYRDAGGLAYKILRTDQDTTRRTQVRDGLISLVADSDTALGRVASALHAHDEASPAVFEDESERDAVPNDERSPWPDFLRAGVHRIVGRGEVPGAKRIEQLMHWVPYCISRHQLALAKWTLNSDREVIPVDATRDTNPLRTRSHVTLERLRWDIAAALTKVATELRDKAPEAEHPHWARFVEQNTAFTGSPRAFFSETLAAVGALNATMGRRHFTLKAPMLEALCAATIEPGADLEFQHFCSRLREDYALVIDEKAAQRSGLTTDIDAGVFKANAEAFRQQLASTGLLTHYSDATSLVHGEAR